MLPTKNAWQQRTWKNWLCLIGTWNNMWLIHLCCSILPFLLHMLHTLILRQCSWRHHVQLVFQFFWVFQFVLFSIAETLNYVCFMILACWEDFISWLLKKLVTFSWPFVFVVCWVSLWCFSNIFMIADYLTFRHQAEMWASPFKYTLFDAHSGSHRVGP